MSEPTTIQMTGATLRFYQGVAAGSKVQEAHAEAPNLASASVEQRRYLFFFYVGALAAGEYGCESQEDFTTFLEGATLRAPQEPDDDQDGKG